jgi:hypothetical protein
MEQRWNDIYRRKPKDSGHNLSQCHFVHNKSHMNCPGSGEKPATNRLCYVRHCHHVDVYRELSESQLFQNIKEMGWEVRIGLFSLRDRIGGGLL